MNDNIKKKLAKLNEGLALNDFFPFGKYGKKWCVERVIKQDPGYVHWCIENLELKLNKEAEVMFMYEHQRFLDNKDEAGDFLSDLGTL